jgi:hypothetical protein
MIKAVVLFQSLLQGDAEIAYIQADNILTQWRTVAREKGVKVLAERCDDAREMFLDVNKKINANDNP